MPKPRQLSVSEARPQQGVGRMLGRGLGRGAGDQSALQSSRPLRVECLLCVYLAFYAHCPLGLGGGPSGLCRDSNHSAWHWSRVILNSFLNWHPQGLSVNLMPDLLLLERKDTAPFQSRTWQIEKLSGGLWAPWKGLRRLGSHAPLHSRKVPNDEQQSLKCER